MGGIYEFRHWDGASAKICIRSFIKIGSAAEEFLWEDTLTDTQTAEWFHTRNIIFFQIKQNRPTFANNLPKMWKSSNIWERLQRNQTKPIKNSGSDYVWECL